MKARRLRHQKVEMNEDVLKPKDLEPVRTPTQTLVPSSCRTEQDQIQVLVQTVYLMQVCCSSNIWLHFCLVWIFM